MPAGPAVKRKKGLCSHLLVAVQMNTDDHPVVPYAEDFDRSSVAYREETPDDQTVASSYMAEDDADRMIQHKVCGCPQLKSTPQY